MIVFNDNNFITVILIESNYDIYIDRNNNY